MSGTRSSGRGSRTLAEQLRGWPDDRLSRLLRERPDLATPAPQDSAQLAARATTRASVLRALDQLTLPELRILDALVVTGPAGFDELASVVRASVPSLAAAVERLGDLVLVWESATGLRPVSTVAEALTSGGAPGASGLRPVSTDPPDPDTVRQHLDEISPAALALLRHVDESGGQATTGSARHTVPPDDADSPAEELLARRLLVVRSGTTAWLPGEVGLALRGGRTTVEPVDVAPEIATSKRSSALVDRAAAGAAFEAVRRVELLLDHWGTRPPGALRSGGLGVRDLKAAAGHLHVDEPTAALLVEVASAAGLLALGTDQDGDQAWLPTDAFDRWSAQPVADRWVALASAWLATSRLPGLVGTRDRSGKTRNALAPEMSSVFSTETRRMALEVLAEVPADEVLAAGTGVPSVAQRVAWLRPRRPESRADQVGWALAEAAHLGLTGLNGLSTAGRALLADDGSAPAALDPLLPQPVDHVLIQADLTAVAPGPLESGLARRLQLLADVESRGGATVYRFTPGSVRRALDVGWSAAEVHDFVASISRTDVPQPLSYLIEDSARTFGTLRVGHAEAFIRADDEATLSELLHDPSAGVLGLRRIAPTVLVSSTPLDVLLPRLRDLGAAPVVEAMDGTVRVARPDQRRARTPKEPRGHHLRAARETAHVSQVVTAIRAGDRAASSRPADPHAQLTPSGSLTALRDAVESGATVLIGYVDNHGASTERVVDPVKVEGGWLTAYDHRSDDTRTFAVHRITAVRPAAPAG
jgi:hypothetical protein